MTATTNVGRRRNNVMVTDLDVDEEPQRRQSLKVLNTVSGNFNRRSRSAELTVEQQQHQRGGGAPKTGKVQSYFNDLLKAKEKQMEQLLQRLSTLHKFNEEFAMQNEKLTGEVKTLDRRVAELQQQVAQCEHCQCLKQQLDAATTQSSAYEADIEMMQTLIYRLNVQIEHYQDKLRLGGADAKSSPRSAAPASSTPSDGEPLQRRTLAPLLHAYDEMLREKQGLIQQYSHEFDQFTGELKRTLEENNHLLQCAETQRREASGWREERTRLQAQLDVCRTKAEAQTRKSDLAQEKLVEVMHCYEQKVQSLMLDKEHLQAAYARCKAELAAMKSVSVQPQALAAGVPLQERSETLLLEQLKQQHRKELHTLERTIDELTQRSGEHSANLQQLQLANDKLQRDIAQLKTTNKELSRRAASTQHVAEKVKRSRDRLKARLRIALQWAQKLEEGQASIQSTWDALKRLETIVKHKESQVRGMHARHVQEIEKMQRKLTQKEDTIRSILKGKLQGTHADANDAPTGTTR